MTEPAREPEPTLDDLRKRRFALFGYDRYDAGGGWHDLVGLYATEEEAQAAAESSRLVRDCWGTIDVWTEEP